MVIRAVEELERSRTSQPTVLTIGTFDGVHRGHQYIVSQTVARARSLGLTSGVVTFRSTPRGVLRPDASIHYLTELAERIHLLKGLGVDLVVPMTFDLDLAQVKAREFVELLRQYLCLRHLVVGPDFALGHRREGTIPVLSSFGQEMEFTVEVVAPLQNGGMRISSTAVREALSHGDVQTARHMLGRPYAVHGPVVRGYQRGKEMGFPTANIDVPKDRVIPADGVYVTRAYIDSLAHPSVTNVGNNPTFGNAERSVEVFILDFNGSIYDEDIRLEFLERLRGEVRFPSVEALIAQIRQDVEQARAYFREHR